MKNLQSYIINESDDNDKLGKPKSIKTRNNKERKEQLVKQLKHLKYYDYVETLDKMLDDEKTRVLLDEGFGGELGDMQLDFSIIRKSVRELMPTQNEIGIKESVEWPISHPDVIPNYFKNPKKIIIVSPIITFNGSFIIDGHHRWSQVYAYNPDAEMVCCNYSSKMSPIAMLKATQGAIAAARAKQIEDGTLKDTNLPSSNKNGLNLFDDKFTEKKIHAYIREGVGDDAVKELSHYVKSVKSDDTFADYVTDNLMELKTNNPPMKGAGGMDNAPIRKYMPQTTDGGTKAGDKDSAEYDHEGSALNRLKEKPIVRGAIV